MGRLDQSRKERLAATRIGLLLSKTGANTWASESAGTRLAGHGFGSRSLQE